MNTTLTRRRVSAALVARPSRSRWEPSPCCGVGRRGRRHVRRRMRRGAEGGRRPLDDMADDPVATAASKNPALSTLVTAVQKAGLVDTLNNAKDVTVFAPTNDAFAKIPKADLDKVLADKEMLTKILTYHVVDEPVDKADLADGSFKTLQGGTLTTDGSGDAYKVNDSATIVCGDVQTSNATVHIIDTVLMPK